MTYHPKPIETSGVSLSPQIEALMEKLAENSHDTWAKARIYEGWRYGPKRDDAKKEHPDLVPYGDLPDSEKEYDRKAAMETLKAILVLGYKIEPEE